MNFIPSSSGDTIIFGFSSNNEINFSESLTATFVYEDGALFASVFGDVPDFWQEGNVDITQLTLGTSVTTIGQDAFNGCVLLVGSLIIPNRVTTIGSGAFQYCTSLTGSLTLGSGLTSIGGGAFRYNSFTGSLTIPNSVTSIGSEAFYQCTDLTGSLTLGSGLTSIGSYAFRGCSGLTGSLTIPNSVTSIGSAAFYYCSGIGSSLTIPNSATTIGNSAFRGCESITDAYLNQPLSSVGSSAFESSGLTTVHLRPSPNTPAGWTIGSGQIIGTAENVTVVADWTTYPNPP